MTGDEIRWQDRAACLGMDPSLWFPNKNAGRPPAGVDPEDNHGRDGKQICASCPVVVECLQHQLAIREKFGIAGGASPRLRRRLLVAYLQRAHDFDPGCRNRACRWCPVVREHLSHLAGQSVGPVVLNGPGARCGFRSTYARGDRCGMCRLAISTAGRLLEDAGIDLREWWFDRFGENTSEALVDIAKWYVEAEQAEAA